VPTRFDAWAAIIAATIAAVIAVVVPWVTFRLAMQQDHVRWIREQRSELYVDMLAEVYAEQEWLQLETAPKSIQERARETFTDTRLPRAERARLGARGSIIGSRPVNRLFNQVSAEAFNLLLASRTRHDPDGIQMLVRVRLSGLIDELRETVRRELGADRVPLDSPDATRPADSDLKAPTGGMQPAPSESVASDPK
jgi:hypothetical protein